MSGVETRSLNLGFPAWRITKGEGEWIIELHKSAEWDGYKDTGEDLKQADFWEQIEMPIGRWTKMEHW